jgi:hypothetical protein
MNDRQARMRPLAASLPAVTKAALGKRGFAVAQLLTEWEAIMGRDLAGMAAPIRLVRSRDSEAAVLEIRVESAAAVELQHLEPRVIERINAHFGYAAVSRLRLKQGPVGRNDTKSTARAIRRPGLAEERALFRQLEGVEDESLRDALAGLGRAVITDRGR